MFSKISEQQMRLIKWVIAGGWLILIVSLFYDPISAQLTEPNQLLSAANSNCVKFQGECQELNSYPLGARIFWGMVVPSIILTLLVFGHEAWRRICPLSFFSQLPRALGLQRHRLVKSQVTETIRKELALVPADSWLGRNSLYLQLGLLFVGLNIRLLLANSDRLLLGLFLLFTIFSAVSVGYLYGGKTWCNYFCPMAPVHKIYSEPAGLLGSKAHQAPRGAIAQSTCRTLDKSGQEISACVGCKSGCMDLDAERSHWQEINLPDRKLLYYGYVGLVIGFYLYFWLYSGNWSFIKAGVWNETNQLATLFAPGFYLAGKAIAIPKLIAVPLTLASFSGATYAIGLWAEKNYKRYNKHCQRPLSIEQIQHRCFAVATFLAFNFLFFFGVYPTLSWLSAPVQQLLGWLAAIVITLWFVKTWSRSQELYDRERDADRLRRQLKKLDIDFSQFLQGRSLDQLNPDELYAIAKVLPGFTHQYCLQVYTGVLREALEEKSLTVANSLKIFQTLRQELRLSNQDHWTVWEKLSSQEPDLFTPQPQILGEERTVRRTLNQSISAEERTMLRPVNKRTSGDAPTLIKPADHQRTPEEPTVRRSPKQLE